ncbi:MAG: hypothetical protein U0790_29495 [Isosphaeraceae bacterium]
MSVRSLLAIVTAVIVCCPDVRGREPDSRVTTRPVAAIGRPVAARVDHEGTVHLLADAAGSPNHAHSRDEGFTWSAAIPVVPPGARAPGLEYSAWDLAVGRGGRVHVALGSNAWKLKLPQEDWGYYYTHLDPGGKAFAPVRNINRKPSEGFSLAADGTGRLTACWLSERLYANVSQDDGETFAPTIELDRSSNPCNCCTTSATYLEPGKLAILYREETRNERDLYLIRWDQVRGGVARTRVSQTLWKVEACPMSYYTLTRGRRGLNAVWPTRGEIFFARLDEEARPVGPAEIKTPGKAGMRTGMLTLEAPDGCVLVAWKRDETLGWQLYGRDGRPIGEPGSEPSPGNGVAGIVRKDGQFLLFR